MGTACIGKFRGLTVAVEHDSPLHDVVQVLQALLIFQVITLLHAEEEPESAMITMVRIASNMIGSQQALCQQGKRETQTQQ